MEYITSSVNESPVLSYEAGELLEDVRGRAVKFDANGKIVLAKAGDCAVGVGILSNETEIEEGGSVDVQLSAIGLVKAGAEVKAGDRLKPDDDGALIPAGDGFSYIGTALQNASAEGPFIQALIISGYTPAIQS